ncbi:MAG: alpha/beta hydrolase [Chitinophagales bacterium]|nr:alpha/beta hydrolase [Chitinophagales bacterium]
MSSFQSATLNFIIKSLRSTLFIHKTETLTHRQSFERISHIIKFPRFVERKDEQIAGLDGAWFLPKRSNDNKTILYFHGGGFCVGSHNTHRALIARIARASGHPAYGVNYRKAPENPFPAALDDAYAVYMELLNRGVKNIIVAGDSAGGGLCLSLMLKLRNEKKTMPIAAMLISPWTDLSMTGETIRTKANVDPLIEPSLLYVFANKYIGEYEATNPFISPLFADLDNFPPIYIQVGGNEVLLDDSLRLAKKLKEHNVPVKIDVYPGMMHVFHWMAGIVPEAHGAIDKIGMFIKEVTEVRAAPEVVRGKIRRLKIA